MNQSPSLPPDRRVLVLGARGYIGTNLVPRLVSEGLTVRASARDVSTLEGRGWTGVEFVEADVMAPDSLAAALEGVDTAYYLVHSMSAGKGFGKLDLHAAQNFAKAAAEAGVRCIVYLGGLFPEDSDSEHLLSRKETGDALRSGPVPVIELRAGIIVGPGSAAFEVMRDLVLNLPVMVTPRWVHQKSPPIALDNLLEYLVRQPEIPEAQGRIFDCGGPEVLTYGDMMRTLARVAGRREPLIIPVPVLTPRLSSRWLWLVTAVPTPVARALIGGLRHDFAANDAELRQIVPQRLLGFEESVRAAFEAEDRHEVQARWVEGAYPMRGHRREHAFYAKRADGTAVTTASPEDVWAVVKRVGGNNRYFGVDWLWWLRETIDWMIGGPGRNRGRRDPEDLRVGDRVDSWTVAGVEPNRRLTLVMGMKAFGSGVLEFDLEPLDDGGTKVTVTSYWHPAGFAGLVYWYALFPAHAFIFDNMARDICRRAEERARQQRG
jgi:uncharacterized protein YbjT (DUF2867 family)